MSQNKILWPTLVLLWLALAIPLPASDRSPVQAPPAQAPAEPPQTITILRRAWIGPYRVRGRVIPVQQLAPGIYFEAPPRVPRWMDPLGVFAR